MSIQAIRELRERTHLGMTECKSALDEAQGNVEKAVEILQKRGSVRKIDPLLETREGIVEAVVFHGEYGKIMEINCQTDFAARSDIFKNFVHEFVTWDEGDFIEDLWNDKAPFVSKQLGEKLSLKRDEELYLGAFVANHVIIQRGVVRAYNHHSGKIAVLLALDINCREGVTDEILNNPELLTFADELAMQVAANNPLSVDRASMSKADSKKQLDLFEAQVKEQMPNKPQQMIEKIINGKMDKWYQENCLMEQESIVHSKKRLDALASELRKKTGIDFTVKSFIRYELGA